VVKAIVPEPPGGWVSARTVGAIAFTRKALARPRRLSTPVARFCLRKNPTIRSVLRVAQVEGRGGARLLIVEDGLR